MTGRRVRIKKMEMKKKGLRMASKKVRRRKLYCLSSVSIIVVIFLILNFEFHLFLVVSNCVSNKIKRLK